MVEISDQLQCLFSGSVEQDSGSYRIEIPKNELENGSLVSGETYRIAILPTGTTSEEDDSRSQSPSSSSDEIPRHRQSKAATSAR